MGLFNRKHGIIDVIEYEGSQDVLIWRHPDEDFNDGSTLIVGPSQEAIFVKHGQIIGSLPSGTHILSIENHAFLRSIRGLVTGGVTPYQCTIYFVNKMISMAVDWGTDSPIRLNDPRYNVPVDYRSYGDYAVQVKDGHLLLEKLVGTTEGFTHDELKHFFNNLLATKIRSLFASVIIGENLSAIGIDQHLEKISEAMTVKVRPVFEPYGLDIIHFAVAGISYSGMEEIEKQLAEEVKKNIENEHELERHRKRTDVEAEDTVKSGRATAEANKALGLSEKEKIVGEMGKTLAGNPGPMTGGGGMMAGMPGMVGGSIVQPSSAGVTEIARDLLGHDSASRKAAEQEMDGIMPGMSSGSRMEEITPVKSTASKETSVKERIDNLEYMYSKGMLTPEEYEQKRQEILHSI